MTENSLKGRENLTQAKNSERSDGVRAIAETDTPRMTAQVFVNGLVSVLYPCHSDVQLYRPTSVVEMAAIKIDVIRTIHSSTENFLKMLLHLGYLTEHGNTSGQSSCCKYWWIRKNEISYNGSHST
jgi:hypothetical protein